MTTDRTNSARAYCRWLGIALLVASPLVFSVAMTHTVFGCTAAGYDDDHYLSYCARMQGYDQAALYLGLEPEAVDHLQAAEVVFVGNSRLVFAMSNNVVTNFFDRLGARHYMLGFLHDERDAYFRGLLGRLNATAKVYVINADPFFTRDYSEISGPLAHDRKDALDRYATVKSLQRWHRSYCSDAGSVLGFLLCGDTAALYRSRRHGGMRMDHLLRRSRSAPLDRDQWNLFDDGNPIKSVDEFRMENIDSYVENARSFAKLLPVGADCVIITVVPSRNSTKAVGRRVASALGARFIAPDLEGLETGDADHLNVESAKRWAAALLTELTPALRTCL
jgi:hypothetical protein